MHRQDVLNKVEIYAKHFPSEISTVRDIVKFIQLHTDCFERSQLLGHVTGSAWLVNQAGSHVLLTHHKKLDRWLQLGGHADGDCDILAVAMKEGVEESGIIDIIPVTECIFDIDIHRIPERKDEPAHFHYDIRFALKAISSEKYSVSEESHDLSWVPIDKLEEYSHEQSMLRMREKWMAQCDF